MNHNINENQENEKIVEASTEFKRTDKHVNIYGNRTPKRMKKGTNLYIFLIVILLIIITVIASYQLQVKPIDKNSDEDIKFKISEGDTSENISKTLLEAGLIRNEIIFKIYLKLHNVDHFTIGNYKAKKKDNLKEIVNMIVEGRVDNETVIFKILEGKNIRHIAKEINKEFEIPEEEFFNKLNDKEYLNKLIKKYWFLTDDIKDKRIYYSLEGYLFPDTYHFGRSNTDIELIIETMLNRTEEILEPYKSYYVKDENTTREINVIMPIHQIMTIASCAELEGGIDYRKEIVGVFMNRLSNNMSMGSDPTTLYAFKIDLGEKELTQKQLNTENPYNTRGPNMIGKVPVGPICSPSKSSIDATFNYNKTDKFYFVSDKNGKMYFTKTIDEHETKINELVNAGLWFEVED